MISHEHAIWSLGCSAWSRKCFGLGSQPDFASLLKQNLPDGGQLKLPTGCLGMQSHCLDPYGCDGSVKGMPLGLWVDLHGLENVLASAQKPDFASLLWQNMCYDGQLKLDV